MQSTKDEPNEQATILIQSLKELVELWEQMAVEARKQADDSAQPMLFRGHGHGLSDGLQLAANQLQAKMDAVRNGSTVGGNNEPKL